MAEVIIRGLGAVSGIRRTLDVDPGQIPLARGMNSRKARRLCRQSKLALCAADQAWEGAGLDGKDGSLFVAMTHGSTSFLQEFHDYFFDHGPEAASPNAFAGGVAGAPLAAISSLLGLTMGGTTLVGYESCGLELLNSAARLLASGRGADRCLVGACEEHSSLVESLYTSAGWYPDQAPPYLPYPQGDGEVHAGFAMAEGSVFLALSPASQEPGVRYEPVEDPSSFEGEVDLVISGAGGGPQDRHELELLHDLLKRLPRPPSLLFSKPICGEAFAVGPLLSVALGRSVLLGGDAPPPFPLHPRLAYMAEPGPLPRPVKRVLIITADRTGTVEAGLLSCEPSPRVDS